MLSGGSLLTWREAHRLKKPVTVVSVGARSGWPREISRVRRWIEDSKISTMNVAGPRESKTRGIQELTAEFLCEMLKT